MVCQGLRSILKSLKVIIGLACLTAAGHTVAADKLQYAPAEAWVTKIALPKPDEAQKGAPFQVLLANFQVKFAADSDSFYTEFATLVQTPAGLQGIQPTVVWNPDTDTIIIHKVQIHRGEQVIDLLAKGQAFTVVRRESNLERAMLDGVLTGVLQPEDLRVGDVLVYALSTKRHDPVFKGNSEGFIATASQATIGRVLVRAVWGHDKPMRWRYSEDLKGKVTKGKERDEFIIDMARAKSPAVVSEAPLRYSQFGQIEFSQFTGWKQISDLLVGAYDKAATLPSDSPLRSEVMKIRAASTDPKVQAALALRLVEDQVRYLYLGINQGNYIPAGAETTWQRRFGDCKGKTVLLLALLRELGIKAEAALVNTQVGDGFNERLPLVGLFDHVIVRVEIGGKIYWLDATRFGDRDIETLLVPDYRWALPLRVGGADLEALKVLPLDKPEEETFLRLDASAGLEVPARVHAEKIFRGDMAINGNAGLLAMTLADREKRLRELWTENYSWIEPRKVSMRFDELRGELQLVVDGVARMAWNDSNDGKAWKYETDSMRVGWAYETKRESGPGSDAPVVIGFPYYGVWKEEIILPKGGKDFTLEGDPVDQTLGGAAFKRTMSIKGNLVTLEASKRSLVPEISYAENKAATSVLTAMYKKGVYLVAPRGYKSAPKTQVASVKLAGPAPKTADELIVQAAQNYLDQKYDAALSGYSQALRLDPANPKALFGRGMIFMLHKQNYPAAIADFEQVLKSDPTNWQAHNGVGSIQMWQGKPFEAIEAFSKALAIFPNDVYAMEYRGKAYLMTGDKANARKDAEAASQLDPASPMIIDLLTQLALDDDKIEAAKDIVKKALEANPDDIDLRYKLAEVAESCRGLKSAPCLISKAEAVEEYDRIIAVKPTAYAYARRAQARPATERQKRMDDIAAGIKQEPTSNMPLMVRATTIWLQEKNYDKAIEDLNAAIKLNPKDTEPYSLRAQVYLSAGKLDLAFTEIDALVKANPTRAYFFNLSCWERVTRNRELDKALADCNSALSLSPEDSAYLDSRGLVNIRLGKFDLAIADYDAALKAEPKMASSLYGRGIAKLRKGDKAAGNADLDAARKQYDQIDVTYRGYGIKP